MNFFKELLNSDMSIQAVITALALYVLISQGVKKWRDVESSKVQYTAVNAKLDTLVKTLETEKESSKEMKNQFTSLKEEFKDQFNILKLDIKAAFDDLHKVRNAMMKDSIQSEMNHRDLKELKEDFKQMNEKFIKIQAKEELNRGNHAHS